MKRLSQQNFRAFTHHSETSAVLFGSPHGDATLDQAVEFAAAWVRCRSIAFGYVDALEQVYLAKLFAIRVLPTTLLLRRGRVIARWEGRQSLQKLDVSAQWSNDWDPGLNAAAGSDLRKPHFASTLFDTHEHRATCH